MQWGTTSILGVMLLRPAHLSARGLLMLGALFLVGAGLLLEQRLALQSTELGEPPPSRQGGGSTPDRVSEHARAAPGPFDVPEGSRAVPLENFPDDPRLDVVGRMLKSGQYGTAEVACRAVLKERPDIGRAEFLLALAITKQKRYEEAKSHFLAALRSEQKFLERQHGAHFLGWCHYHLGEMAEARSRFEEHLQRVPSEPDSTFGLAVVNIAEDRTEEAAALLDAAFIAFGDAKPRDQARVLVRQSDLALRRDDAVKAESLLAQAALLAPTFPEVWAKTARVKDRLGKSEQAQIARTNEKTLREHSAASSEGGG